MTPVTTDTATATLIKAKTPHFTDFALLPKSSGTTPGTGTLPLSAFNVIINSSLVALIGLFALMFWKVKLINLCESFILWINL